MKLAVIILGIIASVFNVFGIIGAMQAMSAAKQASAMLDGMFGSQASQMANSAASMAQSLGVMPSEGTLTFLLILAGLAAVLEGFGAFEAIKRWENAVAIKKAALALLGGGLCNLIATGMFFFGTAIISAILALIAGALAFSQSKKA